MAMIRNESVARIVMLLCFGTAILSMALKWHITGDLTPSSESKIGVNAVNSQTDVETSRLIIERQNTANVYDPLKSSLALTAIQPDIRNTNSEAKVVVDLSERRVFVYRSSEVIASYPTGVGKKGWETPVGLYHVQKKQIYPIWRHPITGKVFESGPLSPLGDRWIGFWSDGRNQIGFHGTPDDNLVGTAISHGCLRMRNPDVRLLYQQVKMGTPVEVRQ